MILIDLQKAFDTIDHDILIKKMNYLGFSLTTIAWFRSYLEDRKFLVNVGDTYWVIPARFNKGPESMSSYFVQIFTICWHL